MSKPSGQPNEFEKAAQQAREKVAAEKRKQEDEARKKADEAAARAKLEQEQEAARRKQFLDLMGRFHAEVAAGLFDSFARALNVRFSKTTTEGAKDSPNPQCSTQLEMYPAKTPELTVSLATVLGGGAAVTSFLRGKDSVLVQVKAAFKAAAWKSVFGVGQLYDKSQHFVLGDFTPERRAKVEDWFKQRLVEVSGKCAEAFARAQG